MCHFEQDPDLGIGSRTVSANISKRLSLQLLVTVRSDLRTRLIACAMFSLSGCVLLVYLCWLVFEFTFVFEKLVFEFSIRRDIPLPSDSFRARTHERYDQVNDEKK